MSQNTKTEKRVLRFQHESVQKSFEDAAGRTGSSRDQRNLKGSQRRTRQEELARHHGKIMYLIEVACVQARLSEWQGAGSECGYPSSWQPAHAPPQLLHAFPCGSQSRESHMKEELYVELVAKGTPLGLRKCKPDPG